MANNDLYKYKAKCYKVTDGDTIDVMIDFGFDVWGDRRLRLLNVDTPERGQENYTEATEFVKGKVLNKDIVIQTYKTDNFGRYLAKVFLDDETLLSDEIKAAGLIKPNSKWNEGEQND